MGNAKVVRLDNFRWVQVFDPEQELSSFPTLTGSAAKAAQELTAGPVWPRLRRPVIDRMDCASRTNQREVTVSIGIESTMPPVREKVFVHAVAVDEVQTSNPT
jgi:hypothetical protein